MPCQRKDMSRGSPGTVVDRPPTAFKKSAADELVVPWVSNASGWKMWLAGRSAYVAVFLLAAASAAPSTDWDDRWTYESASVLTTVTSQISGLPACQRLRISLSGCLPSVLVKPHGSFVTGTPAVVRDRAMTSLTAWCLVILLGACLQTKPWRPRVSTGDPQQQAWSTQKLQPRCKATATWTASSKSFVHSS